MATASMPPWNAPHNGLLGDASAIAGAAQVNQFLGTHAEACVYQGTAILTPVGTGAATSPLTLATQDVDQPFTMSGTSIGRVALPLTPVGNGADLLASLCADSSGAPGAVIGQARIPASFTTQLGAANGLGTAGPLATAAGNSLLYSSWQSIPWAPPATGATGGLSTAQMAQSGNYFVFAGGVNAVNGNSSATVAILTWTGGSTLSGTRPGPPLPQPLLSGGFVATPDVLCYAGGVNANGSSYVVQSTVYLAAWDPSTGSIGTWSLQAALPAALVDPGVAAYDPTDTVYVVGGSTNYGPESAMVSTVYYATISGQQLTSWAAAQPLPVAVAAPTVAVIGNFLIVAGGYFSSGLGNPAVYYAPINPATGAPGPWIPGPPVPGGLYVQGSTAATDNAIAWPQAVSLATGIAVQDTLTLTWDANGPGLWTHQNPPLGVNNEDQVAAIVATGNGTYRIFNFEPFAYLTASALPVPMISVPLPVTGLTNGTTYHLLLQQQGGDLNDYLGVSTDVNVFPGHPTLLTGNRGAFAWSAASPSGTAVPLQIFSNAAPSAMPLHIWADNGARITSLISATTPDLSVLGVCEATRQSAAANANQGFQAGIAPWTVTGGTVTQSATQSFEGGYAAQVTPSGSAATVYLQSELLPCMPGQSVTAEGRMWFTNAVTSNASMSVNWYTLSGTYISTSSNNISVAAATWTDLANTFTAPATAYQYTVNPALSGTPAPGQVFYVDLARGYPTYAGPQASTVAHVEYASTWPTAAAPAGTGVVQLA